jgi:hypothetical protein
VSRISFMLRRARVPAVAVVALYLAACYPPEKKPPVTPVTASRPAPQLPAAPLAEPPPPRPASAQPRTDTAAPRPESKVTLVGEWSVRTALEEIARAGNLSLALSPQIVDKKYRLSLIDVPASVALQSVLETAGLHLQPSTPLEVPWNPNVVFYQLPVNVDSLSVEAIMKRFGVSRDMADLIVQSRKP